MVTFTVPVSGLLVGSDFSVLLSCATMAQVMLMKIAANGVRNIFLIMNEIAARSEGGCKGKKWFVENTVWEG